MCPPSYILTFMFNTNYNLIVFIVFILCTFALKLPDFKLNCSLYDVCTQINKIYLLNKIYLMRTFFGEHAYNLLPNN